MSHVTIRTKICSLSTSFRTLFHNQLQLLITSKQFGSFTSSLNHSKTSTFRFMENNGGSSVMRNTRLESFLNTDSTSDVKDSPELSSKEQVGRSSTMTDSYVDNDSWLAGLISCVRIVVCFVTMMVATLIWTLILVSLIPWPYERIRQGNIYGHVTGRLLLWILGNPMKLEGTEFWNEKAIYICNHASPIDVILIMWLIPTGTVGIAKKEIIYYPLLGQIYLLANHLRIDRSNPTAAVQSMKEAARVVVKNKLSLIIFPEGTRSKNGRLLPFKKGFAHLALQTRLPIVPIVLTGTHHAWRKGSLHLRPAPISVKLLKPISTNDWKAETLDEHVKAVRNVYIESLPESQKPLP